MNTLLFLAVWLGTWFLLWVVLALSSRSPLAEQRWRVLAPIVAGVAAFTVSWATGGLLAW